MSGEIKHTVIYSQSLQSLSLNECSDKPNDEKVKKPIKKTPKKLKNSKASFHIEAELLKTVYPLTEFKNKFLKFMKEVWNQKHIPKCGVYRLLIRDGNETIALKTYT